VEALVITINGLSQLVTAAHLAALVVDLQLSHQPVAIALNDTVIPSSELASTPLKAGDRVEIVHAVCGG
jgi:sulfur carrier protein